ncbi:MULTISPECIES: DUF1707 domain-containing protein [Corynebacterium]|uniref:DUF1707 domain-containing protein n=1 Tax=Corynebacterium TaxID=1716 RepID=UPI00195647C0|nr:MULTISPECIES: DUF1707 domain-containing protein [Corynebacterium]MDN8624009.1 DUF1707 domain-containing protein [Corynebacterium kroppenstedtii]QRQ64197.1 DUF1707 domain-containing protein [Corynebacterium kroppenstedtii]
MPTNTGPFPSGTYRVSDEDRQHAIELLGIHFSQGRLTIDEYDQRVSAASAALSNEDLNALFTDLPGLPSATVTKGSQSLVTLSDGTVLPPASYGRNIRLGLLLGSSTLLAIPVAISSALAPILFLIPLIFILLYIMKIGPESWHTASRIRQAKRMERDQLRLQKEELELERRKLQLEQKQRRREIQHEAMGSAMDFAHTVMKSAKGISTRRRRL